MAVDFVVCTAFAAFSNGTRILSAFYDFFYFNMDIMINMVCFQNNIQYVLNLKSTLVHIVKFQQYAIKSEFGN